MRPYHVTVGIIFLILGLTGAASAQEIGTARENVCNEGGMFFRDGVSLCETDWHWTCGWYIANWQHTGAPAPDWCGTGHLAVSTVSVPSVYIGCKPYVPIMPQQFANVDFGYQQVVMAGSPYYYSTACDDYNPVLITIATYIYALSEPEALGICIAQAGGISVTLSHMNIANVYVCHYS